MVAEYAELNPKKSDESMTGVTAFCIYDYHADKNYQMKTLHAMLF